MLQFSKKVEYALIALRHMAMNPIGLVFTAKEIAAKYDIPYELLAKILQKLTKAGIIISTQGMRGGYTLAKKPSEVQVSKIFSIIEEENPTIAECYIEGKENCSIIDACTIRKPLGKIQHNLNELLESTTLEQIV
jgi:Rrf2 family protein